ncbi:membrane protein [Spirochaetia bacterium]|nr:membrane protein [Spirochaetia bacterium]
MTERSFIQRREGFWQEFEGVLSGGRKQLAARAGWFPQGFRELTQDLNTARAHGFDPQLVERLNRLVLEGNQLLYGQHDWSPKPFILFIIRTFPQKVRAQWRGLGAACLIFYGLVFFSALLCIRFPDLVYELLPESQADDLEMMYDPAGEHFLVPRDVGTDADMFGFYIYNNISIAFRTFAAGILGGIGSLFMLAVNAVFLGAAAGHLINRGLGNTFFPFIIGHGSFELTAIIISAQGGLLLGYRFFITRGLSRGASLRAAGRDALPLISGAALMLLIAAVIEAFWSSRYGLPLPLRYGAGISGWILLLLYFLFAGRGKRKKDGPGL